MQKLAEICIRRPVFAAMLVLALVVVGAASYMRLSVDRFPSVDLPTVNIRTTLRGASAEEVETEISQRVEAAVNTIEGIDELRSISGPGASNVSVTFSLSRDIDTAAQDVRDRVSAIARDLPTDADPPVITKADNDAAPVITIALSGPRKARELTELAEKTVKEQLERSRGVGQVWVVGGLRRSINVWVNSHQLTSLGLPITAVRDAIARQNAEVPGGNVITAAREHTLRTMGKVVDPASFDDLIVTRLNGTPVRIRDIGRAQDGAKEQRSVAYLNGQPTVTLEVRRQSGANTVEVIDGVKAQLQRIAAQLPPDIRMEIIRDQSRYIHAAQEEINQHLILGSIFASLVVLVFMRNWRSTIIAAIAIPTSLIATFGMMKALNFTLNSVTMLALVLMVGVVIDDAIVVLENIFRFVEEKKMRAFQAARAATAEICLAVLATTLSLVVIFIPVSFMSSVSGRFLYQFGITAAVAVMVSLLVSFTLTPMMSARLLRAKHAAGPTPPDPFTPIPPNPHTPAPRSRRGFYSLLDGVYTFLLRGVMRVRWLVALVALGVIASSVPLYNLVKQEFTPGDVDEAEFNVIVIAPEGTNIEAMRRIMLAIEVDIRKTPGVTMTLATAGGGFLGNVNSGNCYVRIEPHDGRTFSFGRLWRSTLAGDPLDAWRGNYSQRQVMQAVRARLRQFPGLETMVRNYPSFNIGGGGFDLDFVLRGPDLQTLDRYARELRDKCNRIPGIMDCVTSLKLDKPELHVQIDRDRAADLGVDATDIGVALRLMVGGEEKVSRFRDPAADEDYDVQLRLTESQRDDPDAIDKLYLPRRDGGLVQVANLARLRPVDAASRIDRVDRQRAISLRASIAPGFALADRLEAVRAAVNELNLPPAYSTRITGRGRELERTFGEFIWAFALSIIFMYIILAMNYESLIHPFTILLSLPLTVPFALLSIHLADTTLNLYSALGILVLFGVVKKNAILQIDYMLRLRRAGASMLDAVVQANRERLRPILMTTLALVAGMLPLALSSGPGAEERYTIAIVVIGGQSMSLLLTLLVTPVAYSLFADLGAKLGMKRSWEAQAAHLDEEPAVSAGSVTVSAVRAGDAPASAAGSGR
jgi:HAE1 family hydrophobic/amphiphilic exporter-1